MANEEHLKIAKQGVEVWNEWQGTFPNPRLSSTEPDLSGADLRGAKFSGADLNWADLSAANLSGADLSWAKLCVANLIEANLSDAKLIGADLTRAKLSGADLSGADLSGAILSTTKLDRTDLSRADLTGAIFSAPRFLGQIPYDYDRSAANLSEANLRGADLSSADLCEANLKGANLSEAILGWTVFGNNDLSAVKGLENVTHHGPSTIGVDTLFKSGLKIPEVFLRGVGLPEVFITYLPSLIARPIEFYSCFISYSHADKPFARRLHDTLQGRGIRCWLDDHQLLPGDKIYTEVDRGIRLWDKVLLCCSKDALKSWWVDNEIKIAFDKEQLLWRERKKEVLALIPLNLDDYLFSGDWKSGLATEVKARMAADFGGWEQDNKKFEEQFERLLKALRKGSGGKEPSPPTLL